MRGDHNFNIHAPLAQKFNGHRVEILMCQQPAAHELQGDVYHAGVENFDKEWEAKEQAQFSV